MWKEWHTPDFAVELALSSETKCNTPRFDIGRLIKTLASVAMADIRKCLGFKTPFRRPSKSLAKTCKSGSHSPLHLALE